MRFWNKFEQQNWFWSRFSMFHHIFHHFNFSSTPLSNKNLSKSVFPVLTVIMAGWTRLKTSLPKTIFFGTSAEDKFEKNLDKIYAKIMNFDAILVIFILFVDFSSTALKGIMFLYEVACAFFGVEPWTKFWKLKISHKKHDFGRKFDEKWSKSVIGRQKLNFFFNEIASASQRARSLWSFANALLAEISFCRIFKPSVSSPTT